MHSRLLLGSFGWCENELDDRLFTSFFGVLEGSFESPRLSSGDKVNESYANQSLWVTSQETRSLGVTEGYPAFVRKEKDAVANSFEQFAILTTLTVERLKIFQEAQGANSVAGLVM